MTLTARLKAAYEALKRPGNNYGGFVMPGFELQVEQEDLWEGSLVGSLVNWTVNNWAQSELETWRKAKASGQDEIVESHPAAEIWRRGDIDYGRDYLEAANIISILCNGFSFNYRLRDGLGRTAALQYLPHMFCTFDKVNGENVVRYRPSGSSEMYTIPMGDMVILRYWPSLRDPRGGASPIPLSEVLTDKEAAQYMRAVLKNFGIFGGIMSPEPNPQGVYPKEDQLRSLRSMIRSAGAGENRGVIITPSLPVKWQEIAVSPDKLVLEKVRRITEERMAAAFNLPAVVLGYGAGLDKSTYNNLRESHRAAWKQYLIPLQDKIARQLNAALMPEFDTSQSLYLGWDRRNVDALAEDRAELAKVWGEMFKSDICTRNEARVALDLEPSPQDGFYSDLRAQATGSEAKAALQARILQRRQDNVQL